VRYTEKVLHPKVDFRWTPPLVRGKRFGKEKRKRREEEKRRRKGRRKNYLEF
jgi:hypothetical protein